MILDDGTPGFWQQLGYYSIDPQILFWHTYGSIGAGPSQGVIDFPKRIAIAGLVPGSPFGRR